MPKTDDERTTLGGLPQTSCTVLIVIGQIVIVLIVIGVIALVAGLAMGHARDDQLRAFSASYLVSYCFFLSLSLGALFFVALQHLVRAGWSVTVRRLAELLAANTWCLTILFLPILVPFFGLLSREAKRRRLLLGAWAVWMLVVHWIDLYWLVMPTFAPEHLPFGPMDLC